MLRSHSALNRTGSYFSIWQPRNRLLSLTSYHGLQRYNSAKGVPGDRRYKSTETGNDDSGHIHTAHSEGIVFLNNVFPLKLNFLRSLPFVNADKALSNILKRLQNPSIASADPTALAERAIPQSLPIQVKEILPRLREGGTFVKFSHSPQVQLSEIEKALSTYLKENPIEPWFNPFSRVRSFLVRGKPWVEDLNRFPSTRLKAKFVPASDGQQAAELSQEELFSLFRKYGKLADIVPQAVDSKELPRYAYLDFTSIQHAITAKNCMHGYTVATTEGGGSAGTLLKLAYERKVKVHWMRDWFMSHPRIVLPLVAAIVATITVAIFDPVRKFFVKAHITHSLHISDNRVYKWLRSQVTKANDILSFRRRKVEDPGLRAIWDDHRGDIEQIQKWLIETADTFIVIQGPRGSGKRDLVLDHALKARKNTLIIDCKPIQEARGDSATINAAAMQVGYRPVFSWMNSMSSLVDLAAQGTIGTKTGFSETLDSQLDKIWQNTAAALKAIALDGRRKEDKDSGISDDEYLDTHPETRPVVVIDNFLHKSQEDSLIYDKIGELAARLTTTNVAHVIFLTTDVSFSKSLSKALPDRVFRQISLGDCSPEVAKRFIINHLDAEAKDDGSKERNILPSQSRQDLIELDESIETIGGRLTDLEFLARRIKTGVTPKNAVSEIVEQSASEILKIYLLDISQSSRSWTSEQAWLLIKFLASSPSIRYNELLLSDIYKPSGESVLQALEQAELITIVTNNGRPCYIKSGKPVYAAAFKMLTEDRVLQARMDLAVLSELIKAETKGIDRTEDELKLLGGLPGRPAEVAARVNWLLKKLLAGQEKVEKYEKESAVLKSILQKEF